MAENFFTVAGATTDTIPADSGIVTAVFPATASVAVGDSYGGGKVAYILESGDSGYDVGEQHGLIAATADQTPVDSGLQWYDGSYVATGATATALGTGSANTTTIITEQGATATDYAAGLARAHDGGGYSDWFLPSKDELNKLWINKGLIGGFADGLYWSSSEYNAWNAEVQNYGSGVQGLISKDYAYRVRAVGFFNYLSI